MTYSPLSGATAARGREAPDRVGTRRMDAGIARRTTAARLWAVSAGLLALVLLSSGAVAGDDALSKIVVNPNEGSPPGGSAPQADSTSSRAGGAPPGDSLGTAKAAAPEGATAPKAVSAEAGLKNIVPSTKNIKAYGWGEYRVAGRCLCCDNMVDGDCIVVHNTNRTDKLRVKQIVDGKTEADTSNKATYFGDLLQRDLPLPVTLLMAEITLPKPRDIRRVTVHTMVDKEKSTSYLRECQLGYYDQFDRLQWVGKLENKANDDRITFELDRPVLSGCLLIKARDGRSRITEVAIYAEDRKE